ncbi:CID domain-containing protein 1 [Toxocara canis]|uniref:CID domain-containing protein 1 n=1 Tax=Toxocara canis TaxID=6265 RepID=A0A0B2ULW6_TOXCA|nr:CID domain-containing protein 1 [Toxocara canis]
MAKDVRKARSLGRVGVVKTLLDEPHLDNKVWALFYVSLNAIMAGFSEAAMTRRLETLNTTTQSIQTLSMWLLHHQKHNADSIVHLWLKEVKKEIRPARLVNLLYLANDVIQNSRRQCPDFMALFYGVLEPAFKHVSMHADSQAVVALKKILRVFRERQIYAPPKIDRLTAVVTSTLTGVRLVEFNVDLGGTPGDASSRLRLTPTTPPHAGKLAADSPQISTPVDESPEPKRSRVENFDFKAMTQTADELLTVLKKLEDPPSADADTRQLIASFPESIANPSLLKPIKREAEARALKEKIEEAEPVVKEYCERVYCHIDMVTCQSESRVENFDFKAMTQTADELLTVLKKLEDPPSADADTRQLIASFPESIANPSLLKPIKREAEARALKEKIEEAEPVVKEYCERLVEEMGERRNVQRLMSDYIEFLKADSLRNEELLNSVKEKFAKLDNEKAAVKKHLESLPDLSDIPADALTPLPSLSELFKSSNSKVT